MSAPAVTALVVSTVVTAAALAGLLLSGPPRSDAWIELQTGPVVVAIAAPGDPVGLDVDAGCAPTCPVFALRSRLGLAAPQGAHHEARRVQRLPAAALEAAGLPAQLAGEILGEKRGVGETARAESGQNA